MFEYITAGSFAGLLSVAYAIKITNIPQFQLRLTIGNVSEHIYVQCFCLFDNQVCNDIFEDRQVEVYFL